MSIRGIDSQIMVTRTAELTKETASQIKKDDMVQNQSAFQVAASVAEQKASVQNLLESQESDLKLDTERESSSSEGQGGEASPEEENESETASINYVPPGNNIIDIKV